MPGLQRFSRHYRDALHAYLSDQEEAQRSRASLLGHAALADGLGVLDVAAAHHEALLELCPGAAGGPLDGEKLRHAGNFLGGCLAPFEATHRGARDGVRTWRRLNQTLENDAKRIAHLLYDESCQLISAAHIALADLAEELPGAERKRLQDVRTLLREAEGEVRNLSQELRPLELDRFGLHAALGFLARVTRRRSGIRIEVRGDEQLRLAPEVEHSLYRVVQEALANVVRHAHAWRASIEVRAAPDRVVCVVSDDGVGFAANKPDGLGLAGIRERVGALGGALHIESRPRGGTRLQVEIPRAISAPVPAH